MKKEWRKPNLEVLDVSMTMFRKPPKGDEGAEEEPFPPNPIDS